MIDELRHLKVRHRLPADVPAVLGYVRDSLARGLPRIDTAPPRPEPLVIAGGGPSLATTLDMLRDQIAAGALLLAVNEVPHYLAGHGIKPWAAVHVGPVSLTAQCIGTPIPGVRYFIASICPPAAFDLLRGHDAVLWHAAMGAGEAEIIAASGVQPDPIDGGHTVVLRSLMLGHALGFREFHVHGVDSAMEDGTLHAYDSVSDAVDNGPDSTRVRLCCAGKWFCTTPELAGQAQDYPGLFRRLRAQGARVRVYGDGLIPLIHQHLEAGRPAPPLMVRDGASEIQAEMF